MFSRTRGSLSRFVVDSLLAANEWQGSLIRAKVFTGSAPFSNELPHEATFAITRDKRPPRPTHPSMTDELWALTQQCWSRDVHLRPTPLQILRSL